MDPFNNSQQNTKEEDAKQMTNFHLFQDFHDSRHTQPGVPAVASLNNTISGAAGRLVRCSTPGLTQHSLPNRTSHGGVTRRRGGEEEKHFYNTTSPALNMFNTLTI